MYRYLVHYVYNSVCIHVYIQTASKSKLKLNQPRCFGAVAAPAEANTSNDLLPYFTRLWDLCNSSYRKALSLARPFIHLGCCVQYVGVWADVVGGVSARSTTMLNKVYNAEYAFNIPTMRLGLLNSSSTERGRDMHK